jgi:hypothetical protein
MLSAARTLKNISILFLNNKLNNLIICEPIRPYSFLTLESGFFEKIGFLAPRFISKIR